MRWEYDSRNARYVQRPGPDEWRTLSDCLHDNQYVFPMRVLCKDSKVNINKIIFIRHEETSWGIEYFTKYGQVFGAAATLKYFKLIPLGDYEEYRHWCQCDWRQVVLVSGCRCGRSDGND